MKRTIFHIADSHFDSRNRFDECVRVHDVFAKHVEAERPDLVVHAGDLYQRASTPEERIAVADWARRVAHVSQLCFVRGNHDALGDIEYLDRIGAKHAIYGAECPAALYIGDMDILLDPFGSKHVPVRREESVPQIIVSHLQVTGARSSTEHPLQGVSLEQLLELEADAYMLGHVHAHQALAPNVVYAGSPRRTNFVELEPKGYVRWELDGRDVSWRFVELPSTPMAVLDAQGDPRLVLTPEMLAAMRGTEVKLRYHVQAHEQLAMRDAADKARQMLLDAGALMAVLEPVVLTETVARAPEIASASSLPEKLDVLWESRGEQPERREQLLEKARML